jgi:hypothetical protein
MIADLHMRAEAKKTGAVGGANGRSRGSGNALPLPDCSLPGYKVPDA